LVAWWRVEFDRFLYRIRAGEQVSSLVGWAVHLWVTLYKARVIINNTNLNKITKSNIYSISLQSHMI